MKCSIVGSRGFSDFELMERSITQILSDLIFSISIILSGGARGAANKYDII
jgi:hypothetical protein